MSIDADAEIRSLRAVLRDLVALSAIPAAWVGLEPAAVAAGQADALAGGSSRRMRSAIRQADRS
jgi:hypothetical protein